MTRINCVPPEELSRQHLLAEWRELPRVFKLAERAYWSGEEPKSPNNYTLGAGHVKFFYKRLGYCRERFYALREEMLRRGYKVTYHNPPQINIKSDWEANWTPDDAALSINRQRIAERMAA